MFSDDGTCYAAVVRGDTFVENAPAGWRPDDNGLIVVTRGQRPDARHAAAELPLGGATAMTFAPDGRRLAVAESDGRIKIWPLP